MEAAWTQDADPPNDRRAVFEAVVAEGEVDSIRPARHRALVVALMDALQLAGGVTSIVNPKTFTLVGFSCGMVQYRAGFEGYSSYSWEEDVLPIFEDVPGITRDITAMIDEAVAICNEHGRHPAEPEDC